MRGKSEMAATAKIEEANSGNKNNSLSNREYPINDSIHECRLKIIQSFPPKRRESPTPNLLLHFLEPQHSSTLVSSHNKLSETTLSSFFGLVFHGVLIIIDASNCYSL